MRSWPICTSAAGLLFTLLSPGLALEPPLGQDSATPSVTTSVSQLTDVQPKDWAFQTLQSLQQRFDCLEGYPDQTFQGDQSLTRREFAAALQACLQQLPTLNAEDLETLARLQTEFSSELVALRQQVDTLEARTAQLQAQQFSPTTQFEGEAIFAPIAAIGSADSDERRSSNLTLSSRVELELETSFTGRDQLSVALQTGNTPELDEITDTAMARLGFEDSSDNQFELDLLSYSFPVGDRISAFVGTTGVSLSDVADILNPFFSSSGRGSISRFGRRNPIYRQGGGAALGLTYEFSEQVSLNLGYSAADADDPEDGFWGGPYSAIAQLNWYPSRRAGVGFIYIRSYNSLDTGTGSELANEPFEESQQISANSYGVVATIRAAPRFALGGWVGYTTAEAKDLTDQPGATVLNYALTLAFPHLGKEDALGGILIGQPPRVMHNDLGEAFTDQDAAWHLEGFYRFPVTDNISITPGLLVITRPEFDRTNPPIYIGTLRTTFSF